jgi:colicin import membrane protein
MPRPPKGRGPALALAVLAHVLLIAGLNFGVHWRSSEPTTMAAELWSAVPQAAAPRAVEPPPTPQPEVTKPTPVAKPEPPPPAPPKPAPQVLPDPQIAIEKAKQEKAKQDKADREEAQREKAEKERDKAERDKLAKEDQAQKKAAADKLKADKEKEKEKADKADAARQEAIRNANLKRLQGMADATGGPEDTGTALRSSGPSASYAGRVMARIKPNILLTDPVDGNPRALVIVKLAPDGTILDKSLKQSSGVKAWDDAVLRAVDRTGILPRDVDGTVPAQMEIGFRPRDL